jgi:hypothetical protein
MNSGIIILEREEIGNMAFISKRIWLIPVLILLGACVISQGVLAGTTVPVAEFKISDLTVTPGEVNAGKSVTINATLTNTTAVDGVYEATLKINGIKEAAQSLDVPPNGVKTISFNITKNDAGTYAVDIDGKLTGAFTVVAKATATGENESTGFPTGAVIGGVIGVVAVAALLGFFMLRRKTVKS